MKESKDRKALKPNDIVMVNDRQAVGWRLAMLIERRPFFGPESFVAQGWEVRFLTHTTEPAPDGSLPRQGGLFPVHCIKSRCKTPDVCNETPQELAVGQGLEDDGGR